MKPPVKTNLGLSCICKLFAVGLAFTAGSCHSPHETAGINRFALVNRHNILVEKFDPLASLSVGNGNFAFTTDITGLQTFYMEVEKGIPLGTLSNWGWHTLPNAGEYEISESVLFHEVKGRRVPYEHQLTTTERARQASGYFRENPHRLHLGIIRLVVKKKNGEEITLSDLQEPRHSLDLWRGEVTSHFRVEGTPVRVTVFVHPDRDVVAARVESELIGQGRLGVEWLFPYGNPVHTGPGYDFGVPEKHTSRIAEKGEASAIIHRQLDHDSYFTTVRWEGKADFRETEKHRFFLMPGHEDEVLEFSCEFSPERTNEEVPDFSAVKEENEIRWPGFWGSGGAVDFSECTDPRARELERRVVLSQYLTKINGSGNLPPQETGLTFNSWFGKFHLEMIWWHSAHYYNWQREENMAGQLAYYRDIYEHSLEYARLQGYRGVRWPKMVGPEGQNSPSSVGSYLIWQQPHLIYLAEQLYQANPSPQILKEWAGLVFATAEFMADFPLCDTTSRLYHLAPPLIPAQEHWNRETTMDPPFELAYWYWGLTTACKWKERLGQLPDPRWEEVRNNLPAPAHIDNLYLGIGNGPDSYTRSENMRDHPMVLGTLGMLPLWEKVNPQIMRNTLDYIMQNWDWPHTWGWDYPMVAMCATRLLEPEKALDALLKETPKNTYLINGHNYQDERLRVYLPGNGGLLKAVALMCAGWEGCDHKNPGFPDNGKWKVKWENLNPDF